MGWSALAQRAMKSTFKQPKKKKLASITSSIIIAQQRQLCYWYY